MARRARMSITSIGPVAAISKAARRYFNVQDLTGGSAPAYTADYISGIITFTADTAGSAYMLTARSYDINAAAADIWRGKAANAAKYFDFQTDNHRVSKSQLYKQFMDMAQHYEAQSDTQSFSVTQINRNDVERMWGNDMTTLLTDSDLSYMQALIADMFPDVCNILSEALA